METLGENLNLAWSSDGRTIVVGNRNDKMVWVDVEAQTITKQIDMGKEVRPRRLVLSRSSASRLAKFERTPV